jgi:hypothetical protein
MYIRDKLKPYYYVVVLLEILYCIAFKVYPVAFILIALTSIVEFKVSSTFSVLSYLVFILGQKIPYDVTLYISYILSAVAVYLAFKRKNKDTLRILFLAFTLFLSFTLESKVSSMYRNSQIARVKQKEERFLFIKEHWTEEWLYKQAKNIDDITMLDFSKRDSNNT